MDKLSNIPLDILAIIFEMLPTKDAIRTSILSKEWRHKWCSISQFAIGNEACTSSNSSNRQMRQIRSIVNQYLHYHNDKINKFSIVIDYDGDMADWIYFLPRKHVEELILGMKDSLSCSFLKKLPCSVFACEQLNKLQLKSFEIVLRPTFQEFRFLASLHLEDVLIFPEDLEKLVLSCPALETLALWKISYFGNLKIYGPKLKILELGSISTQGNSSLYLSDTQIVKNELESIVLNCPALERLVLSEIKGLGAVEIRGPNIQHMELGFIFKTLSLGNTQNLTSFIFSLRSKDLNRNFRIDLRWMASRLITILAGLDGLKRLSLSSYLFKFVDVEHAKRVFSSKHNNLSTIELYDAMDLNDDRVGKVFLFVLGRYPNLVKLDFSVQRIYISESSMKPLKEEDRSKFCLQKLQEVVVQHGSNYFDTILLQYLEMIIGHSSATLGTVTIIQYSIPKFNVKKLRNRLRRLKVVAPQANVIYKTLSMTQDVFIM